MRVLHLTLKKKWFDMIASGEKKEEYRELKEYWWRRLTEGKYCNHREFDIVRFRNGYTKNAPTMDLVCHGILIQKGNPVWGANPDSEYFVIKLGERIY